MGQTPDYYAILGLLRDATPEEVKRAYVEAAQHLHPDKNQAPGETEIFLEVQQAYETLSNPKRRKAYDATLPKEETPESPILHEILYSRPHLVRLDEAQLMYVLVNLRARNEGQSLPVPPLNVCLVLDRSTSMKDAKMDLLKAAAIQFLRDLRAEDIFSVVAFSDRADVIIPASYQNDRLKLESRIRDIQARGATELFQGLQSGLNEVRRGRDARRVNQVILLTDGHTYGDEEACLNLAEQASREGIGISVMGIGTDWNDAFLDQMASRTGNTSRYIARPQDIQKLLAEKFHELTSVLAEEVTLEGALAEGVQVNYAFRTQPESGPLLFDKTTPLGAILRDTGLSVLFEFLVQPSALKEDRTLLLDGALKIAMAARPTPLSPIRIRIQTETADEPAVALPPPAILQALSRLTLYRMQERARDEAQAGEYDKATRSLKSLAVHLLEQGHRDLANTVLLEAENIQRKRTFSLSGEKEIKYATRALFMQEGEVPG
ncbi:MAG: VWA domain-containing protein [Anaerolineaceae bacterium]|nr:MAG: VWA domain-containing protein [Anaerolineaceae bacterium]